MDTLDSQMLLMYMYVILWIELEFTPYSSLINYRYLFKTSKDNIP